MLIEHGDAVDQTADLSARGRQFAGDQAEQSGLAGAADRDPLRPAERSALRCPFHSSGFGLRVWIDFVEPDRRILTALVVDHQISVFPLRVQPLDRFCDHVIGTARAANLREFLRSNGVHGYIVGWPTE